MHRARMCFIVTFASLAILATIVPSAADASSVTSSGGMWFSASPGETNDVTIAIVDDGSYLVTDTGAALGAGFGCYPVDEHSASCTPPEYSTVSVDLGDGNDIFHGGGEMDTVRGGDGNDEIHGGAGSDRLNGEEGTDLLAGGGGDTFRNGDIAYPDAVRGMYADSLDGGPGADLLQGGAGDFDRADYSGRTQRVSVTLDGVANDGEAGEGDMVSSDVENISGGAGNDLLRGDPRSNDLIGNAGDDVLDGRGGYHDSGEAGDGSDLLLFHDGGIEGSTGTGGALPTDFKFDDLLRCDSYEAPDLGVDTAFADITDAGQVGQVSPGDRPCEQVVMTSAPELVPVQDGRLNVPVGCSAGPATRSCHGDAVVQLPKGARSARTGSLPTGAVIARQRFRTRLGRKSSVRASLNKAGRRAAGHHKRLRAWVTYKYR
jgi:hypothetical protein